ncbi:hypothetical protein PHMEG_0002164 [Phytophthora megakarya]|uniref:Uncharacterized protein n=1 Tax=Phytophthora megakarya TaxID=4795 RepID=A0A225X118_9STRA|nr:hypothetical protein PHMEG_0002164 [Phytophthora megakarya]
MPDTNDSTFTSIHLAYGSASPSSSSPANLLLARSSGVFMYKLISNGFSLGTCTKNWSISTCALGSGLDEQPRALDVSSGCSLQ